MLTAPDAGRHRAGTDVPVDLTFIQRLPTRHAAARTRKEAGRGRAEVDADAEAEMRRGRRNDPNRTPGLPGPVTSRCLQVVVS